jgi:hypothetical protein
MPINTVDGWVATVDPVDLRSAWNMVRSFQPLIPDQQGSISIKFYERACSPGADVMAVWHRLSRLQLLCQQGHLSAWLRDDEPVEAVFQVAATFPMPKMEPGVVRQGPSLDVAEFIKQVEESAKA